MIRAALVTTICVAAVMFFIRFLVALQRELRRRGMRVVPSFPGFIGNRDVATKDEINSRARFIVVSRHRSQQPAFCLKMQGPGSSSPRRVSKMRLVGVAGMLLLSAVSAKAQETVFNVPSGDVLNRGKVYLELDATYMPRSAVRSFTPRMVAGVGDRIEIGLNVNGLSAPGNPQTTLTPTLKWKVYDGRENGWAFLVGDDAFVPVQNRSYRAGNYAYAEWTKTWRTKTRATFGAYDFTADVVASGNRAGGQFAVEQPITGRLTLAADWYTGQHALGYVTPGIILKATSQLTLYGSYQIGNHGASTGNHQMLVEIGWNLN